MLATQILAAHLARITYKDRWTFAIYDGEFEGQHFVIRVVLPDAGLPGQDTEVEIHSMLPPMADLDQFERWLAWRLARVEVHEMREFLKADGFPIFDPHTTYAEHDLPPTRSH